MDELIIDSDFDTLEGTYTSTLKIQYSEALSSDLDALEIAEIDLKFTINNPSSFDIDVNSAALQ